jgi:toxin YoeB
MNIQFTQNAWEEYNYWLDNDKEVAEKIRALIKEIKQNPFKGSGKPEPLRFELQGYWSRRITHEDRLVYKVEGKKGENQTCYIIQCKFHYED